MFEVFWAELQALAKKHGEFVADRAAWHDEYERGLTAEQAFYTEYPEHKPK